MRFTLLTSKNFLTFGLGFNTFFIESIKKLDSQGYYFGEDVSQFILYLHLLYIQLVFTWEV